MTAPRAAELLVVSFLFAALIIYSGAPVNVVVGVAP